MNKEAKQEIGCIRGPYWDQKRGRWFGEVYYKDGTREGSNYSRIIMEGVLGRHLDRDLETVDHINNDKTDDSPDNLQLLTRAANNTKRIVEPVTITLSCIMCNTRFQKLNREERKRLRRNQAGPFCSLHCARQYQYK